MLDEMILRNASKIAIFHILYKNPNLLFPFSISCYFTFFLMNALVYKVARNKKNPEKAALSFHVYKIWQILKHFAGTFCRAQTLKFVGVVRKIHQASLKNTLPPTMP